MLNTVDNIVINRARVARVEEQLLSYAQESLWVTIKYGESTNTCNISMVFKLSNNTRLEILEDSIKAIVARHEVLRTLIKEDAKGNFYQLVLDDQRYPLKIMQIKVTNQLQLDQELGKEINHIYDLSNEYPIRLCLYELINDNSKCTNSKDTRGRKNKEKNYREYYLSIVIHHIAFDGWSVDIFLKDLQEYYRYYKDQSQGVTTNLNLPTLSIQYKDFALWQRSYLTKERLDKQLSFWKNKLECYETLNLITDKPRPKQIDYIGRDVYFEIDKDTSKHLREVAKKLKVSLYSLLLSGYYLMLRAYSSQDDIVIGTPIANRHYSQIENLIGFFVNTLALRIKIDAVVSIKEFIKQVGNEVVAAQLHQDLPFEKLVEELKVPMDTSRHPIFQIMFSLQDFSNNLYNQPEEGKDRILQTYRTSTNLYEVAKFDMSTFIDDSQACLRGNFNYAVSLYTEETIGRFIGTYIEILKQLVDLVNYKHRQKETNIADLSYVNAVQYYQMIETWNKTDINYPEEQTIHELFEEQVKRTKDDIAVVYEKTTLTYQQLNEKANQLANYLRQTYDIKADTLVALCLDRNEHMLITILGVLKAGGAYVPIDPNYPDNRLEYILKDIDIKLMLTNEVYKQRLESVVTKVATTTQANILIIDNDKTQQLLKIQPVTNPDIITTSTNLAYIVYTSGTTGNPKGVMTEHRGAVNIVLSLNNTYDFTKGKKVVAFTSYVFDVSVAEFFTALFRGGILYLLSEEVRTNPLLISQYIIDNNINYIYLPPVLLSSLPKIEYKKLYGIIYAGEPCNSDTAKYWSSNCKLYNYYGTTETTIYSSVKQIVIDKDINFIGSPIFNTQYYVLNKSLKVLPIGAIGELYIGGVGLARGYLNRPELTAERFITNPFQTKEEQSLGKNSRLYKTGDLVRWLSDGNLQYIGRNDFQIKIRGFRIELEEIEAVLSSYEGIKQSVVLAKEHIDTEGVSTGNKYLVGYYVSNTKLDNQDIHCYLSSKLPEYMLPSILVYLKNLPLTINGKLDRKALPTPELTNLNLYVAPRNKIELQVCKVWAEVLGLSEDKVSINDDFFRLGGNSILTIKLVSQLNKELSSNISINTIFSCRNIMTLVNHLSKTKEDNIVIISNRVMEEKQVLSFCQERLWFIHKYSGGINAYNVSLIFKLSSIIKLDILEDSICDIILRHEILRTLIKEDNDGNNYQCLIDLDKDPFKIKHIKINSQKNLDEVLSKELNYIYDLSNEYPIKVCLYHLNLDHTIVTEYYISIVVHHIAFDGWSVDIFLKELQEYYRYNLDKSSGLSSTLNLPILSIQYKDFALWQRNYLSEEVLQKNLTYWKKKLDSFQTLNLIKDKYLQNQIGYIGVNIDFEIDKKISIELREVAKELKVSLYSILLAGYYLMLRVHSNQDDIVVGTPVANRHYSQVENMIGFFANSLVLRTKISSDDLIKEFIKQVGEEVIEAQLHQDLPFEKLVEKLKIVRDNNKHPIFQVMFGVQGFGNIISRTSPLDIEETTNTNQIENTSLFDLLEPYTFIDTFTSDSQQILRDKINYEINLYNKEPISYVETSINTFIDDSQEELRGKINYEISLYNEDLVKRYINTYSIILKEFTKLANSKEIQEKFKIQDLNYLIEHYQT